LSGGRLDIREHLRRRIREAAESEGWSGALAGEVAIELPREFAHGDLSTTASFTLAKALKKAPRDIAARLAERLTPDDVIGKVEVAGGGYVNIFLADPSWESVLAEISAKGGAYGSSRLLEGEKFLVEFVSANPTGPIVVANARAAAFGDSLCRVLQSAGAQASREYYVNDAGMQVKNLAKSVAERWKELHGGAASIPEDGYHGDYVRELAAKLPAGKENDLDFITGFAIKGILEGQKADLGMLDVRFDNWFSEKTLHDSGEVKSALDALKANPGMTGEREGATWFMATQFGDEKDRVLMKADGNPTYLLPDLAYHRNKFSRGFTRLINILGADHQTEAKTLRDALGAAGGDKERLEVIIIQFVHLKRGEEKVVMSKRSGTIVSLRELVEDVGKDAARFFFLLRAPSSHLDFDMDLAKKQTDENPAYYIQYAHARLNSLMDYARNAGVKLPEKVSAADLAEPESRLVLRKLARYPMVLEKAALGRAPHLLTHEMLELAQAVHGFYTKHRVVGAGSPGMESARLALVTAAKQVIANGLGLLGVTAPDRM
jgi:arginyl-tRNA synthetase